MKLTTVGTDPTNNEDSIRIPDHSADAKISDAQIFLPKIHSTNAELPEYFQCIIESTIYLALKDYDGCPPRYDNVESSKEIAVCANQHIRTIFCPVNQNMSQ